MLPRDGAAESQRQSITLMAVPALPHSTNKYVWIACAIATAERRRRGNQDGGGTGAEKSREAVVREGSAAPWRQQLQAFTQVPTHTHKLFRCSLVCRPPAAPSTPGGAHVLPAREYATHSHRDQAERLLYGVSATARCAVWAVLGRAYEVIWGAKQTCRQGHRDPRREGSYQRRHTAHVAAPAPPHSTNFFASAPAEHSV